MPQQHSSRDMCKFCSGHYIRMSLGEKWNFIKFEIWWKKSWVKWVQGYYYWPLVSIGVCYYFNIPCWPKPWIYYIWHSETWTKWPPFSRWHSHMCFLEGKWFNFVWNFIEICSVVCNGWEVSVGLVSLHIKRRPEARGHQKLSRASKFSFRASKFFFFFMFKNLSRRVSGWQVLKP